MSKRIKNNIEKLDTIALRKRLENMEKNINELQEIISTIENVNNIVLNVEIDKKQTKENIN